MRPIAGFFMSFSADVFILGGRNPHVFDSNVASGAILVGSVSTEYWNSDDVDSLRSRCEIHSYLGCPYDGEYEPGEGEVHIGLYYFQRDRKSTRLNSSH